MHLPRPVKHAPLAHDPHGLAPWSLFFRSQFEACHPLLGFVLIPCAERKVRRLYDSWLGFGVWSFRFRISDLGFTSRLFSGDTQMYNANGSLSHGLSANKRTSSTTHMYIDTHTSTPCRLATIPCLNPRCLSGCTVNTFCMYSVA